MEASDASAGPKLYVAVLLSEARSDAPGREPLYEESIVLVDAISEEDALEEAIKLGIADESTYFDDGGAKITWTTLHVVDVKEVLAEEMVAGETLYVRHFRDYESYRRFDPHRSADDDMG